MRFKKYLLNCFLLLIPILLWNIFLVDYLPKSYSPEVFWKDIPKLVSYSENILRGAIFSLPLIMIFSLKKRIEKIGLSIFLIGITIYFLSWLAMIFFPESLWSRSAVGFLAPAFTTIIWLIGIGLIGNESFFRIQHITKIYICVSILFVVFHTIHAYIVFQRFS